VKRDQGGVTLDARAAILRRNLRPHAPRRSEVRLEKHSAGKTHYPQQVREGVHEDSDRDGGVSAMSSGFRAIPHRRDRVQSGICSE
jgi:hypothetical protein